MTKTKQHKKKQSKRAAKKKNKDDFIDFNYRSKKNLIVKFPDTEPSDDQNKEEVFKLTSDIVKNLYSGDYSYAQQLSAKLLEKDSRNANYRYLRGYSFYQCLDYLNCYSILKDDNWMFSLYTLAKACSRIGDLELKEWRHTLWEEATHALSIVLLLGEFPKRFDWGKGLRSYGELRHRLPTRLSVLNLMGDLHLKLGEKEKAALCFQKCLPHKFSAYRKLLKIAPHLVGEKEIQEPSKPKRPTPRPKTVIVENHTVKLPIPKSFRRAMSTLDTQEESTSPKSPIKKLPTPKATAAKSSVPKASTSSSKAPSSKARGSKNQKHLK